MRCDQKPKTAENRGRNEIILDQAGLANCPVPAVFRNCLQSKDLRNPFRKASPIPFFASQGAARNGPTWSGVVGPDVRRIWFGKSSGQELSSGSRARSRRLSWDMFQGKNGLMSAGTWPPF